MKLHFVDLNPAVAAALREAFVCHPEVEVLDGDILEVARHCVVSPANSFGYMDGGIDAAYLGFFGLSLQSAVQDAIAKRPEGYLPVGAALFVKTGVTTIPWMIVAPTMETPGEVPASHAGRALRAVLRLVDAFPVLAEDIYCPGLCTQTGLVSAFDAAQSMLDSYDEWKLAAIKRQDAQSSLL